MKLPKKINPIPISATVHVVRVNSLKRKDYEVGAKIIEISHNELNMIMRYAVTHRRE